MRKLYIYTGRCGLEDPRSDFKEHGYTFPVTIGVVWDTSNTYGPQQYLYECLLDKGWTDMSLRLGKVLDVNPNTAVGVEFIYT